MAKQVIIEYISKFSNCTAEFLNGWCYAFASMLARKFGGEIYWLPIRSHFVCKIDGKYYDVTGDISNRLNEKACRWKDYKRDNKTEAGMIIRDCILKE